MGGTADTSTTGDGGQGGTRTTGTETGASTDAIGTELYCKACYLEFIEPRELQKGELVRCPRCDGYVRDVSR